MIKVVELALEQPPGIHSLAQLVPQHMQHPLVILRGVEVLPDSLGPGPACQAPILDKQIDSVCVVFVKRIFASQGYDAHAAKNRISSRAKLPDAYVY